MTKSQWYNQLTENMKEDFRALKEYLGRDYGDYSGYVSFIKSEGNKSEFTIGHRDFLMVCNFDMSNFTRHFKTFEIAMNENNYGKLKLIEIKDFDIIASIDNFHTDLNGENINFPNEYLRKLEKNIKLI